jgi:hypothetical protein
VTAVRYVRAGFETVQRAITTRSGSSLTVTLVPVASVAVTGNEQLAVCAGCDPSAAGDAAAGPMPETITNTTITALTVLESIHSQPAVLCNKYLSNSSRFEFMDDSHNPGRMPRRRQGKR